MTLLLAGVTLWAGITLSPPQPVSLSFYGDEYVGRPMYSGRAYDPAEPVCASPDRPIGQAVLVCAEGGCTGCVILDRMPRREGDALDMAPSAFERIAPLSRGRVQAMVSEVRR